MAEKFVEVLRQTWWGGWRKPKSLWVAWRHLSTASPWVAWGMLAASILSSCISPLVILLNQQVINTVAAHAGGAADGAVLVLVGLQTLDGAILNGFTLEGWDLLIQEQVYQVFRLHLLRHFAVGIDADTANRQHEDLQDLEEDVRRAYWNLSLRFFSSVESFSTLIGLLIIAAQLPIWLLALVLFRATLAAWVAVRYGWTSYLDIRGKNPERKRVFAAYNVLTASDFIEELHHFSMKGTRNFIKGVEVSIQSFLKILRKLSRKRSCFKAASAVLGGVIVWITYEFCLTQRFSAGEFVRYIEAMTSFSTVLVAFLAGLGDLLNGAQTARRIDEFVKEPARHTPAGVTPESHGALDIAVKDLHVVFTPTGAPSRGGCVAPAVQALRGVNLVIPGGHKVALLGENGAGKSTLVGLLEGLNLPYIMEGQLLLGGHDVREWDREALESRVAVCRQLITIFPTTLSENIAFVDGENGEPALIRRAAELVGVEDLIEEVGLDTLLRKDAGGRPLSGGQRQKIAILRAVYHCLARSVGLLIADEATSAVDPDAAARIYRGLLALPCTSLFVAHSLPLARLVGMHEQGRIIILENGQIVEGGSDEELVSRQGRYYRLLRGAGLL